MKTQNITTSLRQLAIQSVATLCELRQSEQREVYSFLSNRLCEVFGVNICQLPQNGSQCMVDVAEQNGLLNELYSIVCAETTYLQWEW
ncbi:hypothetical protein [Spirosoma migulaei]